MPLLLQRLLQERYGLVVIGQERRNIAVVLRNGVMVGCECHDGIEQGCASVVHRNLQEGGLQEVSSVVFESIVVVRHVLLVELQVVLHILG